MTARRAYPLTVAGLVLTAFVLGSFTSDWTGMAVLALTSVVLLVGGFRPRFDPVGIVAAALLLSATGLVSAGAAHVGWPFDLAG